MTSQKAKMKKECMVVRVLGILRTRRFLCLWVARIPDVSLFYKSTQETLNPLYMYLHEGEL